MAFMTQYTFLESCHVIFIFWVVARVELQLAHLLKLIVFHTILLRTRFYARTTTTISKITYYMAIRVFSRRKSSAVSRVDITPIYSTKVFSARKLSLRQQSTRILSSGETIPIITLALFRRTVSMKTNFGSFSYAIVIVASSIVKTLSRYSRYLLL